MCCCAHSYVAAVCVSARSLSALTLKVAPALVVDALSVIIVHISGMCLPLVAKSVIGT
jgi:hypothetical protein